MRRDEERHPPRLGPRLAAWLLVPLLVLAVALALLLRLASPALRGGPLAAVGLALAAAATLLLVVHLRVSRPLARLTRQFHDAASGGPPTRVPVSGDDELARLAVEFNHVCERSEAAQRSLQGEQQMRQQFEGRLRNTDRLAGLGRLSAGLAHEIGTPLNVISGRAESLMRHLGDNEAAVRSLRDISTQTERIVHIMSDMLDFARMKPPRRVPTSLEEVMRTVLDMTKPQLARGHVAVQMALPPDLPLVVADGDQLRQVCLNLALNALDAMQEGGTLAIAAAVRTGPHPDRGGPARRWVTVDFTDSGVGIPPENLDRLFDPFFTTKEPGKGTGLGLSVSYGIVREHGGWFDVDSRPGSGTRMTFHLPIEGDSGPDEEDDA